MAQIGSFELALIHPQTDLCRVLQTRAENASLPSRRSKCAMFWRQMRAQGHNTRGQRYSASEISHVNADVDFQPIAVPLLCFQPGKQLLAGVH